MNQGSHEDWTRFAQQLRDAAMPWSRRGLLQGSREIVVARAPGRLDVMGGIADYSGSLVLQWPLAEATFVAVQRRSAGAAKLGSGAWLRVFSAAASGSGRAEFCEISLAEVPPPDRGNWAATRQHFATLGNRSWVAYVAGTLLVLQQDLGVRIDGGIDLVCSSAVPEALGVSSSAAIEVASLQALSQAFDYEIEGPRLAILCQKVENEIVGAPCGVMDQMTAACGEEGLFLQLLCQPAQLQPPLQLPQGLSLWGVDSGVRHAVSGSDYEGVRCGAYMGYRIIAELLSLPVTLGAPGQVQVEDEPFGGFLANVGAELWNRELRAKIPEELAGCDFLERYGGTTDPITRVDPQRLYAVRQPTQHPIEEHARVQRFAHLMKGAGAAAAEELGALMVESHRSYSACGLGNEATERLVELVLQQGPSRGLFGAKITGGGSGGTVAILARADRAAAVREVVETFAEERGQRPYLFQGSSPGACTWGVRRLQ